MSNKYTENDEKKTQTSTLQQKNDEAFINELYDEVSEEKQSQPSELLDQRIISAAHKAVNVSNKAKSNRNLKWYSSLATAASLTLVISLVVSQQSNILSNEQTENMLNRVIVLQKPAPPPSNNESIANTTKIATKEKMVRATQYEKKAQLSKQKSTEPMMASDPASSMSPPKLASTPEVYEKHKVIPLSIKQLQQYILSNNNLTTEKQWLWSLTSENNMAYMISIYQNKLQPLQYSLDKSTYKIVVIPKDNNKKPSLKNKNLLEIKILNR